MIDGASPPSFFERDSRKNENAERLMTCCDFFRALRKMRLTTMVKCTIIQMVQ